MWAGEGLPSVPGPRAGHPCSSFCLARPHTHAPKPTPSTAAASRMPSAAPAPVAAGPPPSEERSKWSGGREPRPRADTSCLRPSGFPLGKPG